MADFCPGKAIPQRGEQGWMPSFSGTARFWDGGCRFVPRGTAGGGGGNGAWAGGSASAGMAAAGVLPSWSGPLLAAGGMALPGRIRHRKSAPFPQGEEDALLSNGRPGI